MRISSLFLLSIPATAAFLSSSSTQCFQSSSTSAVVSSSLIRTRVYTPEQEEDYIASQQQQQKEEVSVSDQVMESVLSKLAKPVPPPPKPMGVSTSTAQKKKGKKDNNAMAFLRKIGKVGKTKDFTNAIGSDEGSGMLADITGTDATISESSSTTTTTLLKKAKAAYQSCTVTGIIDDMTQIFPLTSSGTAWKGVSDSTRGGFSNGLIKREVVENKSANVLEGSVVLSDDDNTNTGFLKMVADLSLEPGGTVDASEYDGIQLEVLSKEGFEFNVHLRTPNATPTSYRHTVNLEVAYAWETVRIPFSSFQGDGGGSTIQTVDPSNLQRIGIVATGQDMDVNLAIGAVQFYNVI